MPLHRWPDHHRRQGRRGGLEARPGHRQVRPAVAEGAASGEDGDEGAAAVGPRELYFFAEMDDADLFADIKEHDGKTWDNDVFELFFKPADDKPGYYEFQVNAANTQFDMFMPSAGRGTLRSTRRTASST